MFSKPDSREFLTEGGRMSEERCEGCDGGAYGDSTRVCKGCHQALVTGPKRQTGVYPHEGGVVVMDDIPAVATEAHSRSAHMKRTLDQKKGGEVVGSVIVVFEGGEEEICIPSGKGSSSESVAEERSEHPLFQ